MLIRVAHGSAAAEQSSSSSKQMESRQGGQVEAMLECTMEREAIAPDREDVKGQRDS